MERADDDVYFTIAALQQDPMPKKISMDNRYDIIQALQNDFKLRDQFIRWNISTHLNYHFDENHKCGIFETKLFKSVHMNQNGTFLHVNMQLADTLLEKGKAWFCGQINKEDSYK